MENGTTGFLDIHHHLLYGLDDGAQSYRDMTAMLDKAAEDNIQFLVATPHIAPGVRPFDWLAFGDRLEEARGYCAKKGYLLWVYPGAEVMYTPHTLRFLEEGRLPTLASSRQILLEFSPNISFQDLETALQQVIRLRYRPILAHVERYECLVRQPAGARELAKAQEVSFQVNCSTLLEGKGFRVNRFVKGLLKDQLVRFVASDAHNISSRPCRMAQAYQALEKQWGPEYAGQVTQGAWLELGSA